MRGWGSGAGPRCVGPGEDHTPTCLPTRSSARPARFVPDSRLARSALATVAGGGDAPREERAAGWGPAAQGAQGVLRLWQGLTRSPGPPPVQQKEAIAWTRG